MLSSTSDCALSDPWHSALLASGYSFADNRRYVCYPHLADYLTRMWNHPHLALDGLRYAPTQIAILAPHLIAGSRLPTRLLGAAVQPLPDEADPQASLEEDWWAEWFSGHDVSGAVAVHEDRVVFHLDRMRPDQQRHVLLAIAMLVFPSPLPYASSAALQQISVTIYGWGASIYFTTGATGNRLTFHSIAELFARLAALHRDLGAPPVCHPSASGATPSGTALRTPKE